MTEHEHHQLRRRKKTIGGMNGGWKIAFQLSLLMFPPLCAIVGYSAIILRDHDQRIIAIETQHKEQQYMVLDFVELRRMIPPDLAEIKARLAAIERTLSSSSGKKP